MAIALDAFIEAMTLKSKYTTSNFKPKKEKVLARQRRQLANLAKYLSVHLLSKWL